MNVYFRLSVEDNCRDSVPTAPSRAVLAPPLHLPVAERMPEIKIPIPRFARILNRSLVGYRSRVRWME